MQPSSRAPTPSSSKRRAARPKASPSGPPQCWPLTPHSPAEGQPDGHGWVGHVQQRLDRRVQRRADDGEPLDHEEVGRLLGQGAAERADRLGAVGAVHLGIDREGDRHLALAALLGDRLAHEADAAARQLGPARMPAPVGSRREQAAGVGGHDVAAGADVAPVQGERVGRHAGAAARRPAVEDDAALAGQRLAQHAVSGRGERGLDRQAGGAHVHGRDDSSALRTRQSGASPELGRPHPSRIRPLGGLCRAPGRFRALARRNEHDPCLKS